MPKVALVILLRAGLLLALFASAALYVDYQHAGDPAFCGVGSGCLAVRLSPYSHLGPVALPTIGLAAYAGLFVFALVAQTRAHLRALAVLAGTGGAIAAALLVVQGVVIRAWCKWCVLADAGAILAAISAIVLALEAARSEAHAAAIAAAGRPRPAASAWSAAGVLAVALPFVWGQYPVIPPLPAPIAALQVPGKVTIVGFTDFECPFCRALHPTMHALVDPSAGRVVLLRRMMPLSGHPGAMPAALAYTCAPPELRDKMADALYAAPPTLLAREGTIGIAEGLGLSRAAFTACLDRPETRAEVDRDVALFKQLESKALPLTFVGPRVILGYNEARIREAVALGLAGDRPALPVGAMFAAFGLVLALAAGVTARVAPRTTGALAPSSPPSPSTPPPPPPAPPPASPPEGA